MHGDANLTPKGEELADCVALRVARYTEARLMALPKLVVLADLDVDCRSSFEPLVSSLFVEPLPQVADLQVGRLRAAGADESGNRASEAVSPGVEERSAHFAMAD